MYFRVIREKKFRKSPKLAHYPGPTNTRTHCDYLNFSTNLISLNFLTFVSKDFRRLRKRLLSNSLQKNPPDDRIKIQSHWNRGEYL